MISSQKLWPLDHEAGQKQEWWTNITSAGFEPIFPAIQRPQIYALDYTATGIGHCVNTYIYTYTITIILIFIGNLVCLHITQPHKKFHPALIMYLNYVNSTALRRAKVNTVISLRILQRRRDVWVAEWLLDSPEQVCSIENVICLLGYVACYLINKKASYSHFEYCSHSLKCTQCSSQLHKRRSSTIRPAFLRGQLIGPLPRNPSFSQPNIHSMSSPTKRSWVPSYWKTIVYSLYALKSSVGGKENNSNMLRQTFP